MTAGVDRLAGAAVNLSLFASWWGLFLGSFRLYENLAHAYQQRRKRQR